MRTLGAATCLGMASACASYCMYAGVPRTEIRLHIVQADGDPAPWALQVEGRPSPDVLLDAHGCGKFEVSSGPHCQAVWFGIVDEDELPLNRPLVHVRFAGTELRVLSFAELEALPLDTEGQRILDLGS
jgi:hypothetical protein